MFFFLRAKVGKRKREDKVTDGSLVKQARKGWGSHCSSLEGTCWPLVQLSRERTLGKGGSVFLKITHNTVG